jgi:RNA polymerase sigma-70 factor (ECF subfamily)
VKRNADSLEQLYRDRYRNFRDIMAGVVGSHDLAREVVQEAFARALRQQRKFRGDGSLEAWVWKIALNVALKKRRELAREWSLDDEYEAGSHEAEPDRDLWAAVRALPPRRRFVVFLRYYADLSYAEIGAIAGISEGTVAATLAQAKEELLGLLDGEEVGR